MPNVTFTVDDELLRKARKVAVDRDTTVTQLLRDFLEQLAGSDAALAKQRAEEFRRVVRKLARPAGGEKFNREDANDRAVLRRY
jgi:hypothetical protein